MPKTVTAIAACLLLSGCATMTLSGYVGKPVKVAVLDYGPPANFVDLPGGQRAFQWATRSVQSTPVTVNSTTTTYGGVSNTYGSASGGNLIVSGCIYTLIAKRAGSAGDWIVTDYRMPSIDCM